MSVSVAELSADVDMKSFGECVSVSECDCMYESGVRMVCDSCEEFRCCCVDDVETTVMLC